MCIRDSRDTPSRPARLRREAGFVVKGLEGLVREALIARKLGDAVPASPGLASFLDLLLRANAGVNLVSREEAVPEVLVARHLIDALEALPLLPSPGARRFRLMDIGSGGGFPAIPLLLARRDLDGVLVESVGKKARFLRGGRRRAWIDGPGSER